MLASRLFSRQLLGACRVEHSVPSVADKRLCLRPILRAKPKIANYPFTTIIPNLGVWIPTSYQKDEQNASALKGSGSEGLVMCDVPGLISGAARGVGLGHAFLRHVERCRVIVHLVDATSNDPVADYVMLNQEILQYGQELANKPQVVVVNKVDAYEDTVVTDNDGNWESGLKVRHSREQLKAQLEEVMPHTRLMWMSARDHLGVDELMERLLAFVNKVKTAEESGEQG